MDRRTPSPQTTAPRHQPTHAGAGADARPAPTTQAGPALTVGPALVKTVRHFFPHLNDWLQAVPDSRDQDACTYETRFLAWWGILLYLFQLGSRRQLNFRLDAQGTCVLANLNRLADTH